MREQTGAQAGHKGGGWVEGGELKKGVVVKTSPKKKRRTGAREINIPRASVHSNTQC